MVAPKEPLIQYARSGGILGLYEKVDIYADGKTLFTPNWNADPVGGNLEKEVLDNLIENL